MVVRLYLLRHGEVSSHRGDVPITAAAEGHAFDVGKGLGSREPGRVLVLTGETSRAVDTATHLARGLAEAGCDVVGPEVAFALRNPDLYVAGARVNMVSSADALADQVGWVAAADVASLSFFPDFFASSDRIGWWLSHDSPPGEGAEALIERIRAFLASLSDPVPGLPEVVVAVTHSPLVRAAGLDLLGRDIGEPAWVSGLVVEIDAEGTLSGEPFDPEWP